MTLTEAQVVILYFVGLSELIEELVRATDLNSVALTSQLSRTDWDA